jgi:hypothetical protein
MAQRTKTNRGVYLDLALDDEMRIAAARERVSISRFISDAVRVAIAKQKRRLSAEDVAA